MTKQTQPTLENSAENSKEVPWQVTFPGGDKHAALIALCQGNENMASALDRLMLMASWKAKNQGVARYECKEMTIPRSYEKFREKLKFNPVSERSFITYLNIFHEWGFVLSKRYGRDLTVSFENIQQALNHPPAPGTKVVLHKVAPRKNKTSSTLKVEGYTNKVEDDSAKVEEKNGKVEDVFVLQLLNTVEELRAKVEDLQLRLEDLQLKVANVQLSDMPSSRFPSTTKASKIDPTIYYYLSLSSKREEYGDVAFAHRPPSHFSEMSLLDKDLFDVIEVNWPALPETSLLSENHSHISTRFPRHVEKGPVHEDYQASALSPDRRTATGSDPAGISVDDSAMAPASDAPSLHGVGREGTPPSSSTSEQIGPSERKSPQRPATQARDGLTQQKGVRVPPSSESQNSATSGDAPDGGGGLPGVRRQDEKQGNSLSYSQHDSTKRDSKRDTAKPSATEQSASEIPAGQQAEHNAPRGSVVAPDRDGENATDGGEGKDTGRRHGARSATAKSAEETPKREKPTLPPPDAPWPAAETVVQIIEALKGRRYSETTRKEEMNEAKKLLKMEYDDAPISHELMEAAIRDMMGWSFWQEHTNVKPMLKTLRRDDKIIAILDDLKTKPRKNGRPANSKPETREMIEQSLDEAERQRRIKEHNQAQLEKMKQRIATMEQKKAAARKGA